MSASTPSMRRDASPGSLLLTLTVTQIKLLARARKTIALLIIQLIPALAALFYVVFRDTDGLTLFRNIVDHVSFPFLIPLTALFYGGPAIVDEMEGRTLTYLTLRPVPKPLIYIGKITAGGVVGAVLVTIPTLVLFLVCLATSDDLSATVASLPPLLAASTLGVLTYTAIFGALGAIFASSLISSVIYFVMFEMVLAVLPVLELLSVRYHLRTVADLNAADRLGVLDQFILSKPLILPIWAGALILCVVMLGAIALGSTVFKEKQYVV